MEQPSKLRRTDRSPIKLLTDDGFSMILLLLDSESLTRLLIIYQKNEHFKDLVRKSAFCKERLKMYSRSLIFVTFETFDPYMKRDWSIEKLSILENSVDRVHRKWINHYELHKCYTSQAKHNNMIASKLTNCKGHKTHQYYHYLNMAIHYYYLALEICHKCIDNLSNLAFILKSIPDKNKETEDVYKKFIQVVQDPKYTVSNIDKYDTELISGTYCSYGNFLYRFSEKKEEAKEAYRKCFEYLPNYFHKRGFYIMTDNIFNSKRIESGGSKVHDEINLICDICLEFSPGHIKALMCKAKVLQQYPSRYNEAIILYRHILQITPKNIWRMCLLAESLLKYPNATELDRKEGIELYKSCIRREHGFVKRSIMFQFAGLISKTESGYNEAILVYRKLLASGDPHFYKLSLYRLAFILAKTQRGKWEAKHLCEKYLKKEPKDTRALKLLEELK